MYKNGFTLIELLIVIVIIGILAGVAYPSYVSQMQDSRRSEAQAVLVDIANRQEMYYLVHRKYATNLATELGLAANPLISENGYYSIRTSSASATIDFTVTATAISNQASDTQCATLSINQDLTKSATSDTCWK